MWLKLQKIKAQKKFTDYRLKRNSNILITNLRFSLWFPQQVHGT